MTTKPEQASSPVDAAALNLPFINGDESREEDFLSSLGSHFKVLDPVDTPKKKVRKVKKVPLNPIVTGRSPHLYWVVRSKPRPEIKRKKMRAVNEATTVTPKEKVTWAKSLIKNIRQTSKFFENELFPITCALGTAVLDSQERLGQLVDDPQERLPLLFIMDKTRRAVQLKIIDHIADVMNLSEENRRLLKTEFSQPSGLSGANSKPPNDQGTKSEDKTRN